MKPLIGIGLVIALFFVMCFMDNKAIREAPSETHFVTVLNVRSSLTSNAWNGAIRDCAIQVKFDDGHTITIEPDDEHDCNKASIGDRITIYRKQYALDMKGQWRNWEVIQ